MNTTNEQTQEEMGKRKQGRRSNGHGGLILRGNVFYARYTNALGKRVEVSTHCSNRSEAEKVLATYTEPMRKSQSEDEIKLRLQQQLDVLELRKDIKGIARISIDEIEDKFLNHRELMDVASGTRKNYSKQLKKLINTIKSKFPNVRHMDEVSGVVVDGVIDELSRQYTASSFNLALATYRRCWELLSRNNPFKKIGKRKIDKSRHRMKIGDDEVRRIFNSCRDDVERAVWACGVYLGLRCGDVCNLTYGNITWDFGCVVVMPMKTKRHMSEPLRIPICSSLKGLLLKTLDENKIGVDAFKDEPLWNDYKRRYRTGRLCEWFRVTLAKAGLKSSHKDENGHTQIDTGFHVTRRAFVSFASRHLSPLLVQKIVGHSTLKQTAHYCDYDIEEVRRGLNNIPDFSGTEKTRTPDEDALELLHSIMREGESSLDCLKRLINESGKVAC